MDEFVINGERFIKAEKFKAKSVFSSNLIEGRIRRHGNKCDVCGNELDSDYQFYVRKQPNEFGASKYYLICSNCVPKSNSVKAISDTKEIKKLKEIYQTKQNKKCFYCGKEIDFQETFIVYPFCDSEKRLACLNCNNETDRDFSDKSRDYILIRRYVYFLAEDKRRPNSPETKRAKNRIIMQYVCLYFSLIQKWEAAYRKRLNKASKNSGIVFETEPNTIYFAACNTYFDAAIRASLNRGNIKLSENEIGYYKLMNEKPLFGSFDAGIPAKIFSMHDYFDGYLKNAVRDLISQKINVMKIRNKGADGLLEEGLIADAKNPTPEKEAELKEFEELLETIKNEIRSHLSELQKRVFNYKIDYLPRSQRVAGRALNLSKDQIFRAWSEIEYWEKKVCEEYGYSDYTDKLTSKERLAELSLLIDKEITENLSDIEIKIFNYTKANELYRNNDIMREFNLQRAEVQVALKQIKYWNKQVHKKYK